MTETIIHLDGTLPIAVLDQRGWAQGAWESEHGVCAHQAIRLCELRAGDAFLIEQVAEDRWGRGPTWNDELDTTKAQVRAWLAAGIDVTDDDLCWTFGPQWQAVVNIVRQCAETDMNYLDEENLLPVPGAAAREEARHAARQCVWFRDEFSHACVSAAQRAVAGALGDPVYPCAYYVAHDAVIAVTTWDLATEDGLYTIEMRDLLMRPWWKCFGLPDGLVDP